MALLLAAERLFWVRARSVWAGPKGSVLRQITPGELLSVWDYEGKLEPRRWGAGLLAAVTEARLRSPPGKMCRAFAFPALGALWDSGGCADPPPGVPGLTRDVPYSPLETELDVRAGVALPDDREVDLDTWAIPGETREEAKARAVLQKFAVLWWRRHTEREARAWLAQQQLGKGRVRPGSSLAKD